MPRPRSAPPNPQVRNTRAAGAPPLRPGAPPVFPAVPPLLFVYALLCVPPLPSRARRSFPPGTAHACSVPYPPRDTLRFHCFRMTRPIGPPGELFLSFRCVIVVTHPLPSLFPSLDGRVRVCVLPSYANASHLHPSPPPFSSEEMIVSSHASPPRVRAPRPPSPSPRLLTQNTHRTLFPGGPAPPATPLGCGGCDARPVSTGVPRYLSTLRPPLTPLCRCTTRLCDPSGRYSCGIIPGPPGESVSRLRSPSSVRLVTFRHFRTVTRWFAFCPRPPPMPGVPPALRTLSVALMSVQRGTVDQAGNFHGRGHQP
jgi:hypothetical protein